MSTELDDRLAGSIALAGTDMALVKLERLTAVQIFELGAIDPILEQIELEARAEAAKLDISNEPQRKAIASLAYKVARSKTFIDTQRKSLVSKEKKRLAQIDSQGKRIWDRLETLQGEVRKPLTDWENADKERIKAHEDEIVNLRESAKLVLQNWIIVPLADMQAKLKTLEAYKRNWEEFKNMGEQAELDAQGYLREAIEKREYYDQEQIELERFRMESEERKQKEREERAAREATEKANREADAKIARAKQEQEDAEARAKHAEAQRIAAEQAAERRATEAAERAKREQEEAIKRERQRVAAEAERERIATEKREANKRHRTKIGSAIEKALVKEAGLSPVDAGSVLAAISEGKIPNVTITY